MSELLFFQAAYNALVSEIKINKKLAISLCSEALNKACSYITSRRSLCEKLLAEEALLLSTEDKIGALKYRFLSIVAAYFFQWDLNLITSKLTLVQQDILFTALLEFLSLPEFPESTANVSGLSNVNTFAYMTYHRWIIQTVYQDKVCLKSSKNSCSKDQISSDVLIYNKALSCLESSLTILMNLLRIKSSVIIPKPEVNHVFQMISDLLISSDSVSISDLISIDSTFQLNNTEFQCLIFYDLAIFNFFSHNFDICIKNIEQFFKVYDAQLVYLNSINIEQLDIYLNLAHNAQKCVSNKFETKKEEKDTNIITSIFNNARTHGILPLEFFENDILTNTELEPFFNYCTKEISNSSLFTCVFLKYIASFIDNPSINNTFEEIIQKLENIPVTWSGWDSVPSTFLSSITFDQTIPVSIENKYKLIQLEQDLITSYSFTHIQSTLNILHSTECNISYAKRNCLYMSCMEPFISTIDDLYMFDLINVIFSKVEQNKQIEDYKTARELIFNLFEFTDKLMKTSYPPPFIPILCNIVCNQLLICSILSFKLNPERQTNIVAQCKQYIFSNFTGVFNEQTTLLFAITEILNIPDFIFFINPNIKFELYSLKNFVYLFCLIANAIKTDKELPDEAKDIWHILLKIIIDQEQLSSTYLINKRIFIDFVRNLRKPFVLNLILSLIISMYDHFSKSSNISCTYKIPFISDCQIPLNLDSLLDLIHIVLKHLLSIEPVNSFWLRSNADFYMITEDYSSALRQYINFILSFEGLVPIYQNEDRACSFKVIQNMIYCCESLYEYQDALVLFCMLKNHDLKKGYQLLNDVITKGYDIITILPMITNINLLEYLSELLCDRGDETSLKLINTHIKSYLNTKLNEERTYDEFSWEILELLTIKYLK